MREAETVQPLNASAAGGEGGVLQTEEQLYLNGLPIPQVRFSY